MPADPRSAGAPKQPKPPKPPKPPEPPEPPTVVWETKPWTGRGFGEGDPPDGEPADYDEATYQGKRVGIVGHVQDAHWVYWRDHPHYRWQPGHAAVRGPTWRRDDPEANDPAAGGIWLAVIDAQRPGRAGPRGRASERRFATPEEARAWVAHEVERAGGIPLKPDLGGQGYEDEDDAD